MKMTKRFFALLLTVLMLLSVFALAASAKAEEINCSFCGKPMSVVADYSCKEDLGKNEKNYVIYYCQNCDNDQPVIVYLDERADHTPEVVKGTESTCTKKGLNDGKVCSVCGKELEKQTEKDFAPHEWDENNYCKNCGADKLTDRCPYCQQEHGTDFGGKMTRFFHNIAYFFQNMFNR